MLNTDINEELDGGPLKGFRVLDISHVQSAPICGMMLADMGAEVIKLEPLEGDMYRGPIEGSFYENFNRNKRSIAIDLKLKEGNEIALKLVDKVDILIENYVPGALDRLGLGYAEVKKRNDTIIYGSISGFGQNGKWKNRPAFDPIIQALCGAMNATGERDGRPVRNRAAMIDYCAGVMLAFAVTTAIIKRGRDKVGSRLDIALMDIGLYAMGSYLTYFEKTGRILGRSGSAHPATAPNQAFRTTDGEIYIAATSNKMWQKLCDVIGIGDFAREPQFSTSKGRFENAGALLRAIGAKIATWKGADLESRLLEIGVPCGIVRSIVDVAHDPYLSERGIVDCRLDADGKSIRTFMTPIAFSGKMPQLRQRAPLLGEQTEIILDELGYSAYEIDRFKRNQVVLATTSER